ncbi:dynamin-1-like protein isoform X2 [Dysidea avara]
MKTRTPLILQLVHVEDVPKGKWGWVTFRHRNETKFYDLDKVKSEIEQETKRKLGNNKVISHEEIRLRIHSPQVIDLTLVDLPGIVQVPVDGQPEDITVQLRDLVSEYISNPNSIILAVTSDADIVNSESLKLAAKVDPKGERTLTVCTKLDLMSTSTNLHEHLSRKDIPNIVKHGIVGVKCRDHRVTRSVEEAQKSELGFLSSKNLATKHGTSNLAKRIQKLLVDYIKKSLPQVRTQITAELRKHQEILSTLVEKNKNSALHEFIRKFSKLFRDTLNCPQCTTTANVAGGAKIFSIFNEFGKELLEIDPLEGLSNDHIQETIANISGTSAPLFVPKMAFELLVKNQIKLLDRPSEDCVDQVYEKLRCVVQDILNQVDNLTVFPVLKEHMVQVAWRLLDEQLPTTKDEVKLLMANEQAYINTAHPDFVGGVGAVHECITMEINPFYLQEIPGASSSNAAETSSGWEKITNFFSGTKRSRSSSSAMAKRPRYQAEQPEFCGLTKDLLKSYFDLVRKSIDDSTRKTIMRCLVNYMEENLEGELMSQLYKSDKIEELMQESEEAKRKRQESLEKSQLMQKALEALNKI